MSLLLPARLASQPQRQLPIDWSSGILDRATTAEVLLPSVSPSFGALTGQVLVTGATTPTRRIGRGGVGVSTTLNSSTSYIQLGLVDSLLSLNKCTMLILRSLNSLTFASTQQNGVADGANRVAMHLPYNDNSIYWDYANTTTGRLIASGQTWAVGAVDAFALVAGPNKGREIWRNGVKIASSGGVAARVASSGYFQVGAAGGTGTVGANDETIYQFVLINDEISDARIQSWSANPWAIFKAPARRMLFNAVNSLNPNNSVMYIG